eukprot:Colp12_sorted_trinity150504_noHs@24072
MATVTVRLVKSFEYRTIKNLVLHDVDLSMRVSDFMTLVQQKIQTTSGFMPFKNNTFDTLKISHKAHGYKTNNVVVNLDHDEYVLSPDKTLGECGVENETEISFYNHEAYEKYKAHPEHKW